MVFVKARRRREGLLASIYEAILSPGDITAISNLAYQTYQRLTDVPQLNHVKNNVDILRFELNKLNMEKDDPTSILHEQWIVHEDTLERVVSNVKEDLTRLDNKLEKYGVTSDRNLSWMQRKKLSWKSNKIKKLNESLESHKNSFGLLRTTMNSTILNEIRSHHRDDDDGAGSILSVNLNSPLHSDEEDEAGTVFNNDDGLAYYNGYADGLRCTCNDRKITVDELDELLGNSTPCPLHTGHSDLSKMLSEID